MNDCWRSLAELGFTDVETHEVTTEDVTFSLPPWLRAEEPANDLAFAEGLLDVVGEREVEFRDAAFGMCVLRAQA